MEVVCYKHHAGAGDDAEHKDRYQYICGVAINVFGELSVVLMKQSTEEEDGARHEEVEHMRPTAEPPLFFIEERRQQKTRNHERDRIFAGEGEDDGGEKSVEQAAEHAADRHQQVEIR